MKRQILLEPSLLAADPGRLAEQMGQAERGGASLWHLDVMDGHFVPNLSFGPHICAGLKSHSALPINAHLMVKEPSRFADAFLAAGASSVIVHVETETQSALMSLLRSIRKAGSIPAVSLRPGTPAEALLPYLPLIDRVLVMSVEPGYGGQELLPSSYGRIHTLRALIDRENPAVSIQLDGGVTLENAPRLIEAGVDILIAGSAVFNAPDIEARCRAFTEAFKGT